MQAIGAFRFTLRQAQDRLRMSGDGRGLAWEAVDSRLRGNDGKGGGNDGKGGGNGGKGGGNDERGGGLGMSGLGMRL